MRTVDLRSLDKAARDQMLRAFDEPVVLTDEGEPVLVVRSLLDDDLADDLIAAHPDFRASIERARKQKAEGRIKTLAELRQKYAGK